MPGQGGESDYEYEYDSNETEVKDHGLWQSSLLSILSLMLFKDLSSGSRPIIAK